MMIVIVMDVILHFPNTHVDVIDNADTSLIVLRRQDAVSPALRLSIYEYRKVKD